MDSLKHDIRFAIRMLLQKPVFTCVGLLTLALGIGANTAIFSVIDAVLLKPLPYADPDRLMTVSEKPPGFPRNTVSPATFLDWKNQNKVFDQMGARNSAKVTLTGGDRPEELSCSRVTANFFDLLGVKPALGRTFAGEEDDPGKSQVAVITNLLWKTRFGGNPGLVGSTIILNDQKYTIIGILKPDSNFDRATNQIFIPLALTATTPPRNSHFLVVYGRLKSGISKAQAQADMDAIASGIAERFPDTSKGWGVTLDFFNDTLISSKVRQSLLILFGAVILVLLIACANLANLTLARITSRQKEISVRAALGATRGRLVRQFLTESLILAIAGGALGVLLGYLLVSAFIIFIPKNTFPPEAKIEVDFRVLLFTLGVSVITGLIFGLAPAWHASKINLNETMKDGDRGSSGSSGRRFLSNLLIVSEVAFSLVLLIGSFLLIRTLYNLQNTEMGFKSTNLLTMHVTLPEAKYETDQQIASFYTDALARIKTLPGVEIASAATNLPLTGWAYGQPFDIEGQPPKDIAKRPFAHFQTASPDYFRVVSIPVLKGRSFTEHDNANGQAVVIINQTFAHTYFPNEDPIGKHLVMNLPKASSWEIIGVVGDVKINSPGDLLGVTNVEMYLPFGQSPIQSAYLAIKTNGEPLRFAGLVEKELQSVDKNQPVVAVRTMDQIISQSLSGELFNTALLGIFAIVAILLSAIGIYGIISYTVAQHTREIGIRVALGAQKRDVLKLVIGQGMLVVAIGVAVGLAVSFPVTRLMGALLYQVSAADPITFAAMSGVLALWAFIACYIPARRATKVEPMVALRYE